MFGFDFVCPECRRPVTIRTELRSIHSADNGADVDCVVTLCANMGCSHIYGITPYDYFTGCVRRS